MLFMLFLHVCCGATQMETNGINKWSLEMIPGTWYLGVLVQTWKGSFPMKRFKPRNFGQVGLPQQPFLYRIQQIVQSLSYPNAFFCTVQNVLSSCRAAAADTSPICCAPVTMKSTCQQTGCMQSGENCVVQTIRTNKMDCSID